MSTRKIISVVRRLQIQFISHIAASVEEFLRFEIAVDGQYWHSDYSASNWYFVVNVNKSDWKSIKASAFRVFMMFR